MLTTDDATLEGTAIRSGSSSAALGFVGIVNEAIIESDEATITQTLVISVLANRHAWHNVSLPLDAKADGHVVPLDALAIINELNDPKTIDLQKRLPDARPAISVLPYFDVNNDGFCTPNDVLRIINFLNNGIGEGEGIDDKTQWVIPSGPMSLSAFGERFENFSSDRPTLVQLDTSDLLFRSTSQLSIPTISRAANAPFSVNVQQDRLGEVFDDLEDFLDDLATDVCETNRDRLSVT